MPRFHPRFLLGLGSILLAVVLYIGIGTATAEAHVTTDGQIHDHTVAAQSGGGCEAAGLMPVGDSGLCTHGPDPIPPGYDASGETAPLAVPSVGAQAAVCDGDGKSGKRVQVLYVHEQGQPDRFPTYQSSFRVWASEADKVYQESARQTGGQRYIRFVHGGASCTISVISVTVSAGAASPLNPWTMEQEIQEQGFNRNDRKYLIFADTNGFGVCGLGVTWIDDSPGLTNLNNTYSTWAAVYNNCWDNTTTAAHELGHAFGAVQESAPNYSGNGHCTDEWDVMCYADGGGRPMRDICHDIANEHRLDCNHDDYYSTNPPTGNYLKTHWNVANSGFLGHEFSLGKITLSKESSKYNGPVVATLSNFSPGKRIYLKWDGADLTSVVADGAGGATVAFRTPLDIFGPHEVTARDGNSITAKTVLRVIPRILLNETSGTIGSTIRVYFYGFAEGEKVQIQWYTSSSNFNVLKTVTVAANGRASTLIAIPDGSLGSHTIRGKVIGVSRSASTTFKVISSSAEDPTASPAASATATATPESTGTATPEPTVTEVPTATPTEEIPPTETPVEVPTLEPTPVPTETPTTEPTIEAPTETATPEPPVEQTPSPTVDLTTEVAYQQADRRLIA